jgi:hypothetical protein
MPAHAARHARQRCRLGLRRLPRLRAALSEHGQDDGREDEEQLLGLVAAQPRSLGDAVLHGGLVAAEQPAEAAERAEQAAEPSARRAAAAAEEAAEHPAQPAGAGAPAATEEPAEAAEPLGLVERAGEVAGAAGLAPLGRHAAEEHREGGVDGVLGLVRVGADLLADLLDLALAELLLDEVEKAHGWGSG